MKRGRTSKAGAPGQSPKVDPVTYLLARRMERAGVLKPGQAMMLAVLLPRTKQTEPKRGTKK